MTAPGIRRGASSQSDSQSFLAAPAGRSHAGTSHPQERSRDTDDWPDNGRDRDSSRRRFARSLAILARHAAATVLLLLGILFTVPAQAQEPTVPGAPTGLMATADAETNIDLAWTAPADTGGAAITGYRIEVSADGGTTWSDRVADTESTDTAYTHTGLTDGGTRHYRVSAINSAGTGAASNIVGATAMDSTPPAFQHNELNRVHTDGVELHLVYNEGLDDSAGRTPPASAFTVTADGSTVTVTEVRISRHLVLLLLDPVITKGQTVGVSYRDPMEGDDAAAIQDLAGNDAASFTDFKFPSDRQLSDILGAPTNLTGDGGQRNADRPGLGGAGRVHALGLPDRGVRRRRRDLDRPGGRHRVHRHRLFRYRPDGRRHAPLPGLGGPQQPDGADFQRRQRHHHGQHAAGLLG